MTSRFILPLADVGNGISPSDGSKLTFFITGTSTLKDTFSDEAGKIPNTNPVVSDGDGLFPEIWITGTYKVTLTDKNNKPKWEEDPVISGLTTSDNDARYSATFGSVASMLTLTPTGGVAYSPVSGQSVYLTSYYTSVPFASPQGGGGHFRVMTLAEYALTPDEVGAAFTVGGFAFVREFGDSINVQEFGTKADGVTDDTAAIVGGQAHLATQGGGKLIFPYTDSNYRISSGALDIATNFTVWEGQGSIVMLECFSPTGDALVISKNVITLINIRIGADTGTRTTSGRGIFIDAGEVFTQNRVSMIDCQVEDQPGNAIEGLKQEHGRYENVWCERNGGEDFYFHDDSSNIGIGCVFINCRAIDGVGRGWHIQNQIGFTFINCQSLRNGASEEVFIQSGTTHNIINFDVERTDGTGTGMLIGGTHQRLEGGLFLGLSKGISLNTTRDCVISNPRLVGLSAGTPMATGIEVVNEVGANTISLEVSPQDVTTPISDGNNSAIQQVGSTYSNVDITPRRDIIAAGATVTPDLTNGLVKEITLSEALTINAPTDAKIGQEVTFILIQDGTGGWNTTWNGTFNFTTAWDDTGNVLNTRSMVKFTYDGANFRESMQQSLYA